MNDYESSLTPREKAAYSHMAGLYAQIIVLSPLILYSIIIFSVPLKGVGVVLPVDVMAGVVYLALFTSILSAREVIPFLYAMFFPSEVVIEPESLYIPPATKVLTPTEIVQSKLSRFQMGDIIAGYIYIIQDMELTHYYKIGKSRYPVRRIADFMVRLPIKIELIHVIRTEDCSALERLLHNSYAEKRRNGEWFELSLEDIEWIKSIDSTNGHSTNGNGHH